jgi:hypothetical protein
MAALTFSFDTLSTGGHFLCKFYQGAEDKAFELRLKKLFEKVHREKPDSSRSVSYQSLLHRRPHLQSHRNQKKHTLSGFDGKRQPQGRKFSINHNIGLKARYWFSSMYLHYASKYEQNAKSYKQSTSINPQA